MRGEIEDFDIMNKEFVALIRGRTKCVNQAFVLAEWKIVFDRYRCNEQIYEKIGPEYPSGSGDAGGKCMVGVPCSLEIPGKAKKSKSDS